MRSLLRCSGALLLLATVLPPGIAGAQAPPPKLVVLDVLARGVPPALGQRTTALLREQAARGQGYVLAPAPALRLRAMILALGCGRLDLACLGRIARQLEVQQILYGELGRTATGYLLRVQLFDQRTGAIVRTQEREIPESEPAQFGAAVQDTAALALGAKLQLTVESSVEGAIVVVNGQPVGTTPLTTSEGLRGGTNEVQVRLRGYKDYVTKVSLRPGKPLRIRAPLEPLLVVKKPELVPEKPEDKLTPPRDEPFYKRWWFWTIVGAVVAGGTTAAVVGTRGESAPRVGVEF